jgi:CPA1 family monovalent cation:H+ antiporter
VALAFGAFVVAEELGVSGILAVVAAGLSVGNVGFRNTSPTTRLTIQNFWEFLAFMTNSIIFLIIGLQIDLQAFDTNLTPILVAVGAVLLSRAIVVYSISWLSGRLDRRNYVPVTYRHVMFWGGLRGAISLALALTLSEGLLGPAVAQELQVMTFGVVLFTLIVQGTTIAPLIRRLGLSQRPDQRDNQQRIQSLLYARQEAKRELGRLQADGLLPAEIWSAIESVYDLEIEEKDKELKQLLLDHPELEQELVLQARRDLLRAERTAMADALRRGLVQQELYEELVREIDYRAAALDRIIESQDTPEADGE